MEQLLRQRAESIWTAAIRSVLPDEAVRRALEHFHPQGRVFLVAAGKAAWQMAHAALAVLGANWYGHPADSMTMIGVTGTNGKTTVTYLLKSVLEQCLGAKVGLIGTMANMIGQETIPTERTTPESFELQGLFRQMLRGLRFNQTPRNIDKMDKDAPILLIAGQSDPVGDMGAGVRRTHDAFKRAGIKDVTLKLYPGLRHEILNEAAMQDTVYGDIRAWMARVLG